MSRIFYTKPSITEREVAYATDAARNGWGDHCYDYIRRFEEGFCGHLGVPHAIATSSCTGALHLGLHTLGIGPGDEVILADINWIATVAPIVHLGAKPVFVDILPDSWCLDPEAVERALTPKTKAVVATHLYGNLCDMDRLLRLGERHGVSVVEDAAEALGSSCRGQPAGSMGRFGTFSFHGTKTLTTGEGGMWVTRDANLFERCLTLSNHGRSRGQTRQFWADLVGFKYKMSNLQAAVGCAQLERLPELLEAKRRIYQTYQKLLQGLPLRMNPEPAGCRNGFWMPTVVVDEGVPFFREDLLAEFQRRDIDGRVFFWPLSSLPAFSPEPKNQVAYGLHQRAFNLPSYHDLGEEDIRRVVDVVRTVLGS